MSDPNTWTTADGQKIRINKLNDDHLRNIVRFLWRKHQVLILEACAGVPAHEEADLEVRRFDEAGPTWCPQYEKLIAEAVRRDFHLDFVEKAKQDGARYGLLLLARKYAASGADPGADLAVVGGRVYDDTPLYEPWLDDDPLHPEGSS